jgi:hypothetical protein
MSRLGPLFWSCIVLCAVVADYGVKHMVQSLDDELAAVRRKTVAAQKEIHALTAAWTYLNQPEALAELNKRFLGLAPLAPKQLERGITDLPLRPVPTAAEPAPEPPAVAAVAPAPTPVAAVLPVAAKEPASPPAAPIAPPPVVAKGPAPAPATPIAPPPVAAKKAVMPAPSLDTLFAQISGDR